MMPRNLHYLLWFFLLLAAAFAVRLLGIETQSLWFDEGWSAYAAVQPTLAAAAAADATNPPLYYMALHIGARAFGDSEFALRFVSTLFGLLAIALASRLAGRLFGGRAALYAAFLTAFSPLLWWASQEARMYTLLAVLVTIAALAWHRLLKRPTPGAWPALWLAELGLLYAHNTGPVAALWLNAITLIVWLGNRSARRPPWRVWIAGQALVAALWSPYFFSRFLTLGAANSSVQSAPQLDLAFLWALWEGLWAGSWAAVGREPLLIALSIAVGLVSLLIIPWRRAAARWLAAHVVILVGGLVLGLTLLGNELHGRYLVMVAPLLLVAIAAGIARWHAPGLRMAALVFFVTLFGVALIANQNPLYRHDDARAMVRYYADTLDAGDTVLAWSYAERYELAYYWPRLGARAALVTLPEGEDMEAVAPLIPDEGAVGLNVWYTQRADYRGMMDCLLSHGAARPPERFTTYGMTTLRYERAPASLPELRPLEADFGVARLEAAGSFPDFSADRALCLPLEITLTQPAAGELKAALIIQNALGWEVARADVVFATADQRTSASARTGERLRAFPLLRLPYGAPSGDYRLLLRLYDGQEISGYPLVSSGGPPRREFALGVWQAALGQGWQATGRATELPYASGIRAADLTLLAQNLPLDTSTPVANGEMVRLALLWQGAGPLPELLLEDAAGRWRVTVPAPARDDADITLDWREVVIPADAASGEAVLRLRDGQIIGLLRVNAEPMLTEPPPSQIALDAVFSGIGRLAGANIAPGPLTREMPVPVTLVWQAGPDAPADASLTVFVQLLDTDGRLMAQSDALPAGGAHPTTGWRPGEYIIDRHELRWNEAAHPGPARLIAGFYDVTTGERVLLANGQDAAIVSDEIAVR